MNTIELNQLYNAIEMLEKEIERGDVVQALRAIDPLKKYLIDKILLSYLIHGE
ncbi:MAG: hypothetical protein HQK51_21810 [Oligoflexia bacterium]|nr:hypothetical protein [Oligoflexia bacterium]